MQKNGYRLISYKQYCITDLSIFAVILLVAEGTQFLALKLFPGQALYIVSFMLPIVMLVMIRWGWQSVFFALASAVLYCAFNRGSLTNYIVYGAGNCFIMLMLIPLKLIGSGKINSKAWGTVLLILGGWMCVYLGRSIVSAIAYAIYPTAEGSAWSGFVGFAASELLSLVMAIVIVLILRRFDGMVENQRDYLKRLGKLREEEMRRREYGDEPIDIDQEALDILNKDDGLY